jgi:hypothetical protein
LFNCLQLLEPVHGTRGSSGAALSQKSGARAQATCGTPGADLSRETGAGAAGTCGTPRAALSWETGAGAQVTHGASGATLSREVGARAVGTCGALGAALTFVLNWSLYAGVLGPQGTNSINLMHKNPSNKCPPLSRIYARSSRDSTRGKFRWMWCLITTIVRVCHLVTCFQLCQTIVYS